MTMTSIPNGDFSQTANVRRDIHRAVEEMQRQIAELERIDTELAGFTGQPDDIRVIAWGAEAIAAVARRNDLQTAAAHAVVCVTATAHAATAGIAFPVKNSERDAQAAQ